LYLAIEQFIQETLTFLQCYTVELHHATHDYNASEVPCYGESSVLVVGLRYVFKERCEACKSCLVMNSVKSCTENIPQITSFSNRKKLSSVAWLEKHVLLIWLNHRSSPFVLLFLFILSKSS